MTSDELPWFGIDEPEPEPEPVSDADIERIAVVTGRTVDNVRAIIARDRQRRKT